MLTIALLGQKGGGGKSTCCWILTQAALARANDPKVLLIETDSQGSTEGFVEGALATYPELDDRLFCERAASGEEVVELLERAEESGVNFVFVDTEGRHSDLAREVMTLADRIIIPVKPVMHEYRSQLATAAVYEGVRASFEQLDETAPPCGMLLNNHKPTQKLTVEQAEALHEITQHPMILSFFMPYRSAYETLGRGRILMMERRGKTGKMQGLARRQLDADIQEADAILTAIEGMT
jgi:cellulose biosynthesis protein BcsQ